MKSLAKKTFQKVISKLLNETSNNNIIHIDRDENASINILKEGLKILNSAGTVENKGGEKNKTFLKHISVKPEAHHIGSAVCG